MPKIKCDLSKYSFFLGKDSISGVICDLTHKALNKGGNTFFGQIGLKSTFFLILAGWLLPHGICSGGRRQRRSGTTIPSTAGTLIAAWR